MVSPTAHVHLTPALTESTHTPPPRRSQRRRRPSLPSSASSSSLSSSADDARSAPRTPEEGRKGRRRRQATARDDDADEELQAITRQPLSILISPLLCKARPHCPVPLSPSEDSSLSSFPSHVSAASPRRPLFVNRLVPIGSGSALLLAPNANANANASANARLTTRSATLPLSAASAAAPPSTDSDANGASVTRSLSADAAQPRTRSQWRRYLTKAESADDEDCPESAPLLLPQRRIVPRHVPEAIAAVSPRGLLNAVQRHADAIDDELGALQLSRATTETGASQSSEGDTRRRTREVVAAGRRTSPRKRKVGSGQPLIVDFFPARTQHKRQRAQ